MDADTAARAYALLHPKVREWIWDQGWQQLRPTQVRAIGPVIGGDRDVIISAATASGKTEAAWLPICSALAFDADDDRAKPGAKALYISPLKALINDQYGRLSDLGGLAGLPVYRRHGDVAGKGRTDFIRTPDGILLTTPESLEALFVNQGTQVPRLLNGLRYVVIDELHSFIGSERGAQLQSLLHRVELALRRRVPRVALSATIADLAIAAEFLRPGGGAEVEIIDGAGSESSELQLLLRGYIAAPDPARAAAKMPVLGLDDVDADGVEPDRDDDDDDGDGIAIRQISENIFRNMRGKDNLVFANRRVDVEIYTDVLTSMCDDLRVPNEFYAHHGNLSKEHREDVERKLKSAESPATAICTSTLEMGIDIGSADTVGQIGAPQSVAGLRQRLGRSGRRGGPAILRMYVAEPDLNQHSRPPDELRLEIVQAIAVVELLLEGWYEPPNVGSLHLSTLIQQVLSVIAQHGGASAGQLFSVLCADGPFVRVTRPIFLQLLRDLGTKDLISQAGDGTLLPGLAGEKLIAHYSFYAAFATPPEYRLVANGKTLGTMPIAEPVEIGSYLIFAGRRWKVLEVDTDAWVIQLTRARGLKPPKFQGGGAEVADGIRRKMREVYGQTAVPGYLSASAQGLLAEGRSAFRRFGLDRSSFHGDGNTTRVFPWRGDRITNSMKVALAREGIDIDGFGGTLTCDGIGRDRLRTVIARLASAPEPDPVALASTVLTKVVDKHDTYLSDELLSIAYAARNLDVPGAWGAFRDLARS